MNMNRVKSLMIILAAGLVMFACHPPSFGQGTPPAVPAEELPAGSEVLARGPVHEAFAKPVSMDPQAPVVVPQQPPEVLQEMPPAEKPVGADIVWVPGYWAWDADRHDFIWVSGCWRNAPPQTYWVPGHWLQAGDGWQWITGFWKPINQRPQQEIEYLPAPPAAIEVEPPGVPPSLNVVWSPGCWYWSGGHYIVRHGYWISQQVGWVWVPSHYVWTPRGYIFSSGHWDHDLDNRGVLFTPAYFPPAVRIRAGFVFSPGICVDLGMLRLNLFAYPRYNHYYFGDYYDDAYLRLGIYPWFKCQTVHTWYDPLFVYDRWHVGRTEPHWATRQAQEFQMRRDHVDLRPARTYSEFQVRMDRMPAAKRPERPLVQSMKVFAASQSTPVKFERINAIERQQIAAKSSEVHNLGEQRNHWESPSGQSAPARPQVIQPATKPAKEVKPTKGVTRPEVRVTRPEQVLVPNPPVTPRSSQSRYIEKVAPGRPAQEYSRPETTANPKSPDTESRGRNQLDDSQGKDRKR